jgi:hypothetical protein
MISVIKTVKVFDTNLVSEVISSKNLEEAFQAVYKKRKHSHHNNDIWHLSKNWQDTKIHIQNSLLKQQYHLEPLKILKFKDKHLSLWPATDSVVLKAISIVLSNHLNVRRLHNVNHLAGNGGVLGATRKIAEYTKLSYESLKKLLLNNANANTKAKAQTEITAAKNNIETADYKHIIKSDIKSFYASTDPSVLLNEYKKYIKDKKILHIIMQYTARLEDVTYLRHIETKVILTKTKAQHRKCIKIMHNVITKLKFKLAIDKTSIGRIARWFKFLVQRFESLSVTQSNQQINLILTMETHINAL